MTSQSIQVAVDPEYHPYYFVEYSSLGSVAVAEFVLQQSILLSPPLAVHKELNLFGVQLS